MKIDDLDEGLGDMIKKGVAGVKDLANVAKAGYAAGRTSSQGYKAAKGAYQAVRNKETPKAKEKSKKEKPSKPTNQTFNTFAKLPNGASFVSQKGDTYVWNQQQQKWIGNQDVDPKQGLQLFNRAKQKFVPQ